MAEHRFPFAGQPFVLLDWTQADGFGVSVWMAPRGIWGQIAGRDAHPDYRSAMEHAVRFATSGRCAMISAPSRWPRDAA